MLLPLERKGTVRAARELAEQGMGRAIHRELLQRNPCVLISEPEPKEASQGNEGFVIVLYNKFAA